MASFNISAWACNKGNNRNNLSFLDLHLEYDNSGHLSTKIYDKRDDFSFKIINFPYMCSNIPSSPAYGVYISQLIRYARASTNYCDFLERHTYLRNRLLDQGYEELRLTRYLTKFFFRYQPLVEKYSVSSKTMVSDLFMQLFSVLIWPLIYLLWHIAFNAIHSLPDYLHRNGRGRFGAP